MRRKSKYGTNKTIRFCKQCSQESSGDFSTCQVSMNKQNRWELIELLKDYCQSLDFRNKIIVRRNFTFQQYNGYQWSPRRKTIPPKHLTLADRPDFIYQPYVKFLKVNQDIFDFALFNVSSFLKNPTHLERLLDVHSPDTSVTLLYFVNGSEHCFSSDWCHANRHAYGGYLADHCMLCTGDYCPLGPKVNGQVTKDPRINQVLFLTTERTQQGQYGCCSHVSWFRPSSADRKKCKIVRRPIKLQRRESTRLTKKAIEFCANIDGTL